MATKLIALRPCPVCERNERLRPNYEYDVGRIVDIVNCKNCGALFYIGDVAKPVAEYQRDGD